MRDDNRINGQGKFSLTMGSCFKSYSVIAKECAECWLSTMCKEQTRINKERNGQKDIQYPDLLSEFIDAMTQEFNLDTVDERKTGSLYTFVNQSEIVYIWIWAESNPPRLEGKINNRRFPLGVLKKETITEFVKIMVGKASGRR